MIELSLAEIEAERLRRLYADIEVRETRIKKDFSEAAKRDKEARKNRMGQGHRGKKNE